MYSTINLIDTGSVINHYPIKGCDMKVL